MKKTITLFLLFALFTGIVYAQSPLVWDFSTANAGNSYKVANGWNLVNYQEWASTSDPVTYDFSDGAINLKGGQYVEGMSKGVSIDADLYKTAIIKIKCGDIGDNPSATFTFRSTGVDNNNQNASESTYRIPAPIAITKNDGDFKEYIIDLSKYEYWNNEVKAIYIHFPVDLPVGAMISLKSITLLPTVLPVSLVLFTAENQNDGIALNWSTASEHSNKEFIVSRSIDGVDFTELAKIPGKTNSDQMTTYVYRDNQPNSGDNYYQLSQVDYNGKITILKTVTAKGLNIRASVSIFPNPVLNYANIRFNVDTYSNLTLCDAVGNVLKNYVIESGEAQKEISLIENNPGIYFVRLSGAETRAEVIKIIKK